MSVLKSCGPISLLTLPCPEVPAAVLADQHVASGGFIESSSGFLLSAYRTVVTDSIPNRSPGLLPFESPRWTGYQNSCGHGKFRGPVTGPPFFFPNTDSGCYLRTLGFDRFETCNWQERRFRKLVVTPIFLQDFYFCRSPCPFLGSLHLRRITLTVACEITWVTNLTKIESIVVLPLWNSDFS